MANLSRQLEEWVGASLIGEDQARRILAFEASRPGGNRLLYSFVALGASIVALGVISLIATNWHLIPDSVKLGCDFLLLSLFAGAIWQRRGDSSPLAREFLLILFAFGVLASIGLIAQIYHAGGRWDQALLFWAGIILPAVTFSRKRFLPFVWTLAVLAAGSNTLIMVPALDFLFAIDERWLWMLYILPLISATVALLLRRLRGSELFVEAFRGWAWSLAMGMVIVADGLRMLDSSGREVIRHDHPVPFFIFGALFLVGILLRTDLEASLRYLLAILVSLYLLHIPLAFLGGIHHWASALFVLAIFALAALSLVWHHRPGLANLLVTLLGVRFLLLFLTAFGGLMETGLGLVLCGSLILASLWGWLRIRRRLFRWLEGLAS
ncbi:MAG: DUF2157 domain-containing protein [Magnetococcales bacterium]|nr:DUF2157 domain-containing protein [Magnetococcales bacterium]MBF0156242.1 DUF2157 domain-containing protein [Magnetococcales bacterium]